MRGRGHPHVKRGLEVGLVEAGEHALGVGGFELRVQVGLAVHRIDKPMQALAGIGVVAVGVDDDDVALGQSAHRIPAASSYPETSRSWSLRLARRTVWAEMSMTVSAPGSASNTTVVVDRKVRSPGAPLPSVTSRMIW